VNAGSEPRYLVALQDDRPDEALAHGPSLGRFRYHPAAMSKICAVCGKKPGFGHHRSHSMVATKRRFDPNLQRVRVFLKGKAQRAYVCTRCLKAGKVQKAV
jgi:large subunit ribosomal protein L28